MTGTHERSPRPLLPRLLRVLQIAVTLALGAWLFSTLDRSALDLIGRIDTLLLIGATALFASAQIFGGLRLSTLLHGRVHWKQPLVATWIGYFFSNFLPGTVGGDVVRAARLKAAGVPLAVSAGALLLDRLLNVAMLLAMAAIAVAAGLQQISTALLIAGAVAVALGLTFLMQGGWMLFQRFPRFNRILQDAAQPVRSLVAAPSRLAASLLLTICNVGVSIVAQWLLARALGLDVSLFQIAGIASVVTIVAMVPISFNGLGLQETSFVLALTQLGASDAQAVSFALLVRYVIVVTGALGGLVFLVDRFGQDQRNGHSSS